MTIKRIRNDARDERGASAVIVALLMVALLGFAAISVDVGKLYWEKAQLQNGADTAAISIANACAKSALDAACTSPVATAQGLANSSANDGASTVESATVNTLAGTVTVNTAASETGASSGTVSLWFARILGYEENRVAATATAGWGTPTAAGSKFPLAFSACEIDSSASTDGTLQFIQSHGVGDKVGDDGCHKGSSGQEIPGGFGWLNPSPATECSAQTEIDSWSASRTGNSWESNCTTQMAQWEADLKAGKEVVLLLPVFNGTNGSGSGGEFKIWAYAAFELHGWHFTGGGPTYMPADAQAVFDAGKYKNSDTGFVGRFIRYVFTEEEASAFSPSPSPTGANIVRFIN